MAEVDIDFNGKLDILEFLNLMKNIFLVNLDNLQDLDMAFKAFDWNGDGISRDEMKFIMMTIGEDIKDEEFGALLNNYHSNAERKFTYEQFISIFSHIFLFI